MELIKLFRACLCLDNAIGRKVRSNEREKRYYQVQFGDVIFYRFLLDIGLTPKKSKTIGSLKIPDDFFFDFLRGYFDGDGSVFSHKDRRWKNSIMHYLVFISASRNHLQWIQDTNRRLLSIRGAISQGGRGVFQLRYAKRESRLLAKRLYYHLVLPYGKRKFRKLQKIMGEWRNW